MGWPQVLLVSQPAPQSLGLRARGFLRSTLCRSPRSLSTSVGDACFQDYLNCQDRLALQAPEERVPSFDPAFGGKQICLQSFMDRSPHTVRETFSLGSAYRLFRTLGLRHLYVTSGHEVVGVITRKELLEHNLAERVQTEPQVRVRHDEPVRAPLLATGHDAVLYSGQL